MHETSSEFSPLDALHGKTILLTGTTGFLAKVILSMLLERFSLGRVYCLVRAQRSKGVEERFWDEIMGSEMMGPLKARLGPALEVYVREKVRVISGDIALPNLGLEDSVADEVRGTVDVVLNSAGLVTFNPPLDDAIKVNAKGAREVARFTASCAHASLLHVSTCFVAGNQTGRVPEADSILGYFPKAAALTSTEFDWQRELQDVERDIESARHRTEDAALESQFRQQALDRLRAEGREAQPRALRAAVTHQRRRWVADELTRLGLERASYWGWPNIYTYSKALGEQAVVAEPGLRWAIVRPAIVESAYEYPFPGWNEGMNTTAPLSFLGINHQPIFPTGENLILDVVPVDAVASATIAAAAALVDAQDPQHGRVYQVAAGDVNPCSVRRTIHFLGLYKRRLAKRDEASGKIPWWQARLRERAQPLPRSREQFERMGTPMFLGLAKQANRLLENKKPERYGPLSGLVAQAKRVTKEAQSDLSKVDSAFDLFMPFISDNRHVFRSHATRSLFSRMNEADQALLPYKVDSMDWRHYWLDVHLPGLEKWVFPKMETSTAARVTIPKTHRDLAEMFDSRTEEHARRVAFRMLRKDDVADTFSYRDVRRAAYRGASFLQEAGLGRGDRVLLMSENRPEWGVAYFAIIVAGGTVVPVDVELSVEEIRNICRASDAKFGIVSDKERRRLADSEWPMPLFGFNHVFDESFEGQHRPVRRKSEDIASVIFTSGTTGKPKGVMLTDRNYLALAARISTVFDLRRTDALLSVLPLHHTFEFSAGFMFPINAGASVTYLESRTPELLSRAFDETPVTAMIGVPAVWEALHRKIVGEVQDRGRIVELGVRSLMTVNRWLRAHSPWNFGRWIFRPMHRAVGGRMRLMVSGGAALRPQVYDDFRGLGFSLYEGYGLTEASPVLAVARPHGRTPAGSVGPALPGIEIRINEPDQTGIGEIIARGPTIMAGYFEAPEATQQVVQSGWLHTGDRGRFDDEGRLYVLGRDKDVVLDASGKNVYPDEIEALYGDHSKISELCVVGVPTPSGHSERLAALVVPDLQDGEDRSAAEAQIKEHFREVGAKAPITRRVKLLRFWPEPLPKTSTRKIKRGFVRDTLERLERANDPEAAAQTQSAVGVWLRHTVARIAHRDAEAVDDSMRLVEHLGFDSLMLLELLTSVEERLPGAHLSADELAVADTVGDVIRLIERVERRVPQTTTEAQVQDVQLSVPPPLVTAGRAALRAAQRLAYDRVFDVRVEGRGNIPANRTFIIAANHASHIDMGLVKHAISDISGEFATLAAKDYFFDNPVRQLYFENFTNLIPMDRNGPIKRSLQRAVDALRSGRCLLVFPEGTRSRDGEMREFRSAIGYLSLNENVDVLPVFLEGTHDALPVGAAIPKGRRLFVRIGTPVRAEDMAEETRNAPRSRAYRVLTAEVERRVRALGGVGRANKGVALEGAEAEASRL